LSTQAKDGESTTYVYDDNDRLMTETFAEGVTTYDYNANGSTTAKHAPDGTTTYAYDFEKRMTQAVTPTGTTGYTYDADGNRVTKTDAGGTTGFVVDAANNTGYAQVVAETGAAGVMVAYTYGDDLISQTRGGATSFYHYDGLGSTRALTDAAGIATDTYTYEAFGDIVAQTGSTPNSYMFTGEQYDPNVGFYYLRARYYNPSVGRFHTVDPWGGSVYDPVSLHKYLYCHGDSVNHIDPSGRGLMTVLMIATLALSALVGIAIWWIAQPPKHKQLYLDFEGFTLSGVVLSDGSLPNAALVKQKVLAIVGEKFSSAGISVVDGSAYKREVAYSASSGDDRDAEGKLTGITYGVERQASRRATVYLGNFTIAELNGKFTTIDDLAKAIALITAHEGGHTFLLEDSTDDKTIMQSGSKRKSVEDLIKALLRDPSFNDAEIN
jgi:RHS repeat-associated protein